jgi:hypothetical protein
VSISTDEAPNQMVTVNADLSTALTELKQHHGGYSKAEDYAAGEVSEVFASVRLRRALRRSGLTYQFNLAKTPITAVVERLKITSITSEDETQKPLIEQLWNDNKFSMQGTNIMRKACTFGDAYVLVWPDDEHDDEQDDSGVVKRVNIFFQDPRTCRVFYDPENPLKVAFGVRKWKDTSSTAATDDTQAASENKPLWRVDLYYDDRIEQYISRPGTNGDKPEDYVPCYTQDQDGDTDGPIGHVLDNPYGMPIFHLKTDADEYGEPEHAGFYSTQDAILKLLLTHLSGVEYQSFNQRWALMNDDSDSSEAADLSEGYFAVDMQDIGTTRNMNGDAQSQFQGGPDSLFMSTGIKQFGQFDASDPSVIFDPLKEYIALGALTTCTPLYRLQPGGQPPSGESLKIMDKPFVFKVDNRKLSFGQTLKDIYEFGLKILGIADPAVVVNWAPSETSDSLSDWELAQAKQAAGIPDEVTWRENGYTDDQISEWQQDGEAALPRKVALLQQAGGAVASFATAVAAGILSPEQVQVVISKLIGDISDDDTRNPD